MKALDLYFSRTRARTPRTLSDFVRMPRTRIETVSEAMQRDVPVLCMSWMIRSIGHIENLKHTEHEDHPRKYSVCRFHGARPNLQSKFDSLMFDSTLPEQQRL